MIDFMTKRLILLILLGCSFSVAGADTYLYKDGDSVVGMPIIHTIQDGDNFIQLAQKFRIGFDELVAANPSIDPWIPEADTQIIVPTQYILPNTEHKGVIINLAELRLYHFHQGVNGNGLRSVSTYPISVGKGGQWETPLTFTHISAKTENPSWYPPESIRKEHEENDDPLPEVIPPGPDNPLGDYALRLALPGYLIHGTNVPQGIGMRVTHGCIRLHPSGIQQLFNSIKVKTPVTIVNQPYKVGWQGKQLFVETHSNIEEQEKAASRNLTEFVQLVVAQTSSLQKEDYQTYWEVGYREARLKRGIPFIMSRRFEDI